MKNILDAWSKDKDIVLKGLDVNPNKGLTSEEAESRLREVGENILKEEREIKFARVLSHEVREPMIILLLVVGVIYSIFGNLGDALTIFAIIAVLVFVEIFTEYRAKKTIEELKKMASPLTSVIREGDYQEINSKKLVPGDIIILKVGQNLSADARLIEAFGLQSNESALTGESTPILKKSDITLLKDTEVSERKNMVFAGSTITRGKGKGVVVATGMDTELGHIAGLTKAIKEPKTPLQLAMKQLTYTLVWVALFFSILIPVIGIIEGRDLVQMILTGLSLSFATIPEELPIVIMVVLALGSMILSRKNALVKYLRGAETLGSVTVIATDKTGTLTENKMKISEIYSDGKISSFDPNALSETQKDLLEVGFLLNDVIEKREDSNVSYIGDPMEIALIESGKQAKISEEKLKKEYILKNEFSFDNERMMMSQIYQHGETFKIIVKGATEAILQNSTKIRNNNEERPLSQDTRQKILDITNEMGQKGLRILAFAYRQANEFDVTAEEAEKDLIFSGMIGFLDPPREEVKEAIGKCLNAGVKVKMITGDYEVTAKSIAKAVGMREEGILRGNQLSALNDKELQEKVKVTNIFARTTPEQKLRIVSALKENGEVIAVTGDGINDTPALKKADIGIAMGLTGTDVARETADMVLLDDNFATITLAIEEGRKLYDNLKKGIRFYLSVKIALIVIFLLPVLFDIPLPFAPIQIILLELFMDLAASATFVIEVSESDVMKRTPRDPNAKFIDTKMKLNILAGGGSLIIAVLSVYFIAYFQGVPEANSMAFATWMLSNIFLAFNMRTDRDPLYKVGIRSNKMMIFWAISAIATTFIIIYVPFLQLVFRLKFLNLFDWLLIIGISIITTFWKEVVKIIKMRK